jgi:hypothetical protein
MKQKQSQRVVVNINTPKPKRKKRAKKSAKKKIQPIQPPIYSPMPQSTIRYYDNPIPQRNITFNPPVMEAPKILGVQPETEYEQPVSVARKQIKVKTPQPETEHVLLRYEEPVLFGGQDALSARDVIEEQGNVPAREQPAEEPQFLPERPKPELTIQFLPEQKRKISPLEATQELPPPKEISPLEATQLTFTPAQQAEEPEEDQLQKVRKLREPEAEWYKKVKKEFERANKAQKEYDLQKLGLTEKEAKTAYKDRRRIYIDSIGTDTTGFSYVEPPKPNMEASGGGISFVKL